MMCMVSMSMETRSIQDYRRDARRELVTHLACPLQELGTSGLMHS